MYKQIFFIIFMFFILHDFLKSQTIIDPSGLKNNIVSLEIENVEYDTTTKEMYHNGFTPIGTAFLIGVSSYFKGHVFMVTCKHVLDSFLVGNNGNIIVRFSYNDSTTIYKNKTVRVSFSIKNEIGKRVLFSKDPCYDIAVIVLDSIELLPIDYKEMKFENLRGTCFPISQIKTSLDTLHLVDHVILGGYPNGLKGQIQNYILFRFGIVSAIIEDSFETLCKNHILINTETIGGDSGSPVMSYPNDLIGVNKQGKLIGLVSGNYFTGLTVVEPIEVVMKVIDDFLKDKENLKIE